MPHRVADPDAVKRVEERIRQCEQSILWAKAVKARGSNIIDVVLETVRAFKENAEMNRDSYLFDATPEAMTKAHGFLRMAEAYKNVLNFIENPDAAIPEYEEQIRMDRDWLEKAKSSQVEIKKTR